MFSILKKKEQKEETKVVLKAYVSGKTIPIDAVEDEVFSSKALGDGIAIEPKGDTIYAPCSGVISVVTEDSWHAIGMTLDNGAEILIHEGIDTVSMQGEGFEVFVKVGERVKAGQKLLQFNPKLVVEKGYKTTCIMVLMDADNVFHAKFVSGMEAIQGETIVAEIEK